MTLQVIGKIEMQCPICEKCGTKIQVWKHADIIKCKECGALYELITSKLQEQHIDYEFNFTGFRCINTSSLEACDNICPAPGMYCREHTSDESFVAVRSSINYAVKRLANAKENLDKMKESRKIWLIQEVSGIDE